METTVQQGTSRSAEIGICQFARCVRARHDDTALQAGAR